SRVKAAAWIGSSWPGIPSVRTSEPGFWAQPVRTTDSATAAQKAIRYLISASRGSILTAGATCLGLAQKGTAAASDKKRGPGEPEPLLDPETAPDGSGRSVELTRSSIR